MQPATSTPTGMSARRPSLASPTRKRKLSADEPAEAAVRSSPTSHDEVSPIPATPEPAAISPKKKARAEPPTADAAKWSVHLTGIKAEAEEVEAEEAVEDEEDQYEPIAWTSAPAAPLSHEELRVLNYFLA